MRRGERGIVARLKIRDEFRFGREHGVGIEVRVTGHEYMGRDCLMTGRRYNEVQVRRAKRMPPPGFQHATHRPIGWYRIRRWFFRHKRIFPGLRRLDSRAKIPLWRVGILDVIELVAGSLPNVEGRAGQGFAVGVRDPPGNQELLAAEIAFDQVRARFHFRRAFDIERAQNGRLRTLAAFRMIDGVDHHRQSQGIGKQDEFLALLIAFLTGFGEELDALKPFCLS